jgi:hypothetical protein
MSEPPASAGGQFLVSSFVDKTILTPQNTNNTKSTKRTNRYRRLAIGEPAKNTRGLGTKHHLNFAQERFKTRSKNVARATF